MAINLGSGAASAFALGATDVSKVYLGSTEVYAAASGGTLLVENFVQDNQSATASPAATIPTHVAGDLLLVAVMPATNIVTVTPPDGWTRLTADPDGGEVWKANQPDRLHLFHKRAASASETFTATLGSSTDVQTACIRISGATSGYAFSAFGTQNRGLGSSATAPDITGASGDLELHFCMLANRNRSPVVASAPATQLTAGGAAAGAADCWLYIDPANVSTANSCVMVARTSDGSASGSQGFTFTTDAYWANSITLAA